MCPLSELCVSSLTNLEFNRMKAVGMPDLLIQLSPSLQGHLNGEKAVIATINSEISVFGNLIKPARIRP